MTPLLAILSFLLLLILHIAVLKFILTVRWLGQPCRRRSRPSRHGDRTASAQPPPSPPSPPSPPRRRRQQQQQRQKVLIVWGSGGHGSEMRQMFDHIIVKRWPVERVDYVHVAASGETVPLPPSVRPCYRILRARNVHQSMLLAVPRTLWAILQSWKIILRERPTLVLTNGPGTCLPTMAAALLFNWLLVWNKNERIVIVYVESIARVTSLSLTAKLVHWMVDRMISHWPELAQKYPRFMTYYGDRLI